MPHSTDISRQAERFWLKQLSAYRACFQQTQGEHVKTLAEKIKTLQDQHFDGSVVDRLNGLLRMRKSKAWELSAEQQELIDAMQAYLIEEDDVVPDSVPGIGLMDDAMVIAVVAKRLQRPLARFCEYEDFYQRYASHGHRLTVADWKRLKAQEVRSHNRIRRLRRISTSY